TGAKVFHLIVRIVYGTVRQGMVTARQQDSGVRHISTRMGMEAVMRFEIAGVAVRVEVTDEALIGEDGRSADGLYESWHHQIRIAERCSLGRRRFVLFHELGHAWEDIHGERVGDEGRADNAAAFTVDMMQQ